MPKLLQKTDRYVVLFRLELASVLEQNELGSNLISLIRSERRAVIAEMEIKNLNNTGMIS